MTAVATPTTAHVGTVRTSELVRRAVRTQARVALWWTVGIVAMSLLTAALWPSLEGTDALSGFENSLSPDVLEAFGAQNLSTAAGYLDGQIFALLLPLLLSACGIAVAAALASGDEDAGRWELLQALPVSRSQLWSTRLVGVLVVLAGVAGVLAGAMVATLPLFSLEEAGAGRVVGATVACALLAAFHASVVALVAGLGGGRGRAIGVAVVVLVAGYIGNFLLPLVDAAAPLRRLSPWYWSIGQQPVSNGVSLGWFAVLLAVTGGLICAGLLGYSRRDLKAP